MRENSTIKPPAHLLYKPDKITMENLHRISSFISIQAPIGAGKSSLLEAMERIILRRNMSAKYNDNQERTGVKHRHYFLIINEPVKSWLKSTYTTKFRNQLTGNEEDDDYKPILQLFSDDMTEFGFPFQIVAFTTRFNLIRTALGMIDTLIEPDAKVHIISERSLSTDRLFFNNLYESNMVRKYQYDIYNDFYDMICESVLPKEDIMIYLDTSVERCYERILERGRKEEEDLPYSYLESLDRTHKSMIEKFKRDPRHRVFDVNFDVHLPAQSQIDSVAHRLISDIIAYVDRVQ